MSKVITSISVMNKFVLEIDTDNLPYGITGGATGNDAIDQAVSYFVENLEQVTYSPDSTITILNSTLS